MNTEQTLENARAKRDKISCELAQAKISAAEASAMNATAVKAEKVKASKAAAVAKCKVSELNAELKAAEKALRVAEKKAEKAAKAAEKAETIRARQEAVEERMTAAETDPFQAFDIDWTALGRWLAERAADRVCHVEGAGWGEWTGTHWEFSRKPSATLLDRVRAAYAEKEGEVAEKLRANPRGALYLLEHAQGTLTLPRHMFNAPTSSHLVAFQNVTVDLRAGKTMKHDPKHYMTGAMKCDYDPTADVERVETAFGRFWPGDTGTARSFRMALGYTMTGEVSAKRMFFMVGNQTNTLSNGDNGKSLVQNALARIFGIGRGGWGTSVKSQIILDTGDRDANSHDGAKTPLIWHRYATASEFRHGSSIDAGEFNRLSGGDEQSARPPHAEEAVPFINRCGMWFSMNTTPRFKSWDKATRVRLTPFPFTETFHDPGTAPEGGQEKEFGLAEWLASDDGMRALGVYLVRGAMDFYKFNGGKAGNLFDSDRVNAERESILNRANPYFDMFEANFVFDKTADTLKSAVTALLRIECGHNPKPAEKALFQAALEGQGVVEVKVKGTRYLRGLHLTESARKYVQASGFQCPEHWRSGRSNIAQIAAE